MQYKTTSYVWYSFSVAFKYLNTTMHPIAYIHHSFKIDQLNIYVFSKGDNDYSIAEWMACVEKYMMVS